MDTTPRLFLGTGFGTRRPNRGLARVLSWLGGFLAAGVAVAVGLLLAVFATVAMATFAVAASIFVFFTSVALRAQRRAAVVRPTVIEARKVGHAWVAYGWDRNGR